MYAARFAAFSWYTTAFFGQQQQINLFPTRPLAEQPMGHENIKERMASILKQHFGVEPKGRARVYQKWYLDLYDNIQYPRGYRVPEFIKFTRDDCRTTLEHITQFIF